MNKRAIALGVIGISVAFLSFRRLFIPDPLPPTYNPSSVPDMPTFATPDWVNWVNSVQELYGSVSWLWAPGGPFYQIPTSDIYDVTSPDILNTYDWTNPNYLPTGLA